MKKLLSILITLCMMLTLLPATALAAVDTFTAPITAGASQVSCTFTILTEPDGTTNGTVQVGNGSSAAIDTASAGALTIPTTVTSGGNTYTVTTIGRFAFNGCAGLTGALTIPAGVTKIDYGAFEGCSSLTGALTIPDSVTSIGSSAFEGCAGLTGALTIPAGINGINGSTFSGCTGLTGTLTIPAGVSVIYSDAFNGCKGLTGTLIIPDSVYAIGDHAFNGCTGLTGVTFAQDSKCNTINDHAFNGCTGLTGTLTIPASVTDIYNDAFSGCTGLDSATFLGTTAPTIMDSSMFTGTKAGFFITVPAGATDYTSSSWTLVVDGTDYTFVEATGTLTVKTNDGTTNWRTDTNIVGSSSTKDYTAVKSVVIESGVTAINDHAFNGCTGLTGVTIPASVTAIGERAFSGCTGLTSVTIPASVTSIGESAFGDCTDLTAVTFLGNAPTMGADIFLDCTKLASITIPAGATGYTGTPWDYYTNEGKLVVYSPAPSGSSIPSYSITNATAAAANGSLSSSNAYAKEGTNVKLTPKADEGYELDTLTAKDAKGNEIAITKNADGTFSFKMPSGKVTVEATFKAIETPWVNPFADVTENDWFFDAVQFVNEKGLFEGTGADTFSPNAPMTRAMLWTVLGRLDGQTLTGTGVFAAAKAWATEKGITDGSNPGNNISREQLVTILWRYAGAPKASGDLSKFSDADSVADYAKDAMAWAVENGIVEGADGKLMPTDDASRAQVSAIMMRYSKLVK